MTTEFNLTFGQALEELKKGYRISRKNWNGKNMFLYLQKGMLHSEEVTDINDIDLEATLKDHNPDHQLMDGVHVKLFNSAPIDTTTIMPHICMITATDSIVNGWLASQTDMLASDWGVLQSTVEDPNKDF